MQVTTASGLEYLALVTSLLQRARRRDPDGGLWEAADLQWWWRRDQHDDPARQIFWIDDVGPVASVIFMDWGDRLACELISADPDLSVVGTLWPVAAEQFEAINGREIELTVRGDDPELLRVATDSGFVSYREEYATCWMSPAGLKQPAPLPAGFNLLARSERMSEPHHMIERNGPHVAERLDECSIYFRDLDLVVLAPDGAVAAYCLFWADPTTGVGLVEPMRTIDAYQGKGLGRHILRAGLGRLVDHGCTRLKVTYDVTNDAARNLYIGAGFTPAFVDRTYRLTA